MQFRFVPISSDIRVWLPSRVPEFADSMFVDSMWLAHSSAGPQRQYALSDWDGERHGFGSQVFLREESYSMFILPYNPHFLKSV